MVDSLGGRDLNQDGSVINLAIVGSSRFYDYEIFDDLNDGQLYNLLIDYLAYMKGE